MLECEPEICEPVESMPRAGEFIIAAWGFTWLNLNFWFKFYYATGPHHSGPAWGAAYRTEEGESYKIEG